MIRYFPARLQSFKRRGVHKEYIDLTIEWVKLSEILCVQFQVK